MTRILPTAAAFAGSLLLPLAAPAQGPAGYYTATPVAKPDKDSLITSNVVWRWRDTAFVAPKAPSRDKILCEMIVRRVGPLTEFTAAGQPFDADALAKCNARAR